jgi:hypothetical protein
LGAGLEGLGAGLMGEGFVSLTGTGLVTGAGFGVGLTGLGAGLEGFGAGLMGEGFVGLTGPGLGANTGTGLVTGTGLGTGFEAGLDKFEQPADG